MENPILTYTLLCYGCFLILSGVTAVVFIGLKAKTALISGGSSGGILLLISWMNAQGLSIAIVAGIVVTLALLIVFFWRSTKTLFAVFEMLQTSQGDLKGKGIAFLIISLMAVVSLMVLGAQLIMVLNEFS